MMRDYWKWFAGAKHLTRYMVKLPSDIPSRSIIDIDPKRGNRTEVLAEVLPTSAPGGWPIDRHYGGSILREVGCIIETRAPLA